MNDMDSTIAIKLPVEGVPAKAVVELKKMTGLSISEIKSKTESDDYLLVRDYADLPGLKLMNRIRREMGRQGIKVRQFEDGIEKPSELFDNLEDSHTETALEMGLLEEDL